MANPTFNCSHMEEHCELVSSGDIGVGQKTVEQLFNEKWHTITDRNEDNTVYFITDDAIEDFNEKMEKLENPSGD